ncbi:hypothetical protein J2X55_002422 [Microbacterium sp. 1154]|uniref:hypothetical protein n=1 Tax=Microbacterium sp. 1154 TaxID=2817733 RepID=UPI00285A7CB4|nr:hypothetical protein [Microbacterium sp. 1154]MDR6691499.1 hypothetical protein [Microbacterium sp. 1154]
MSDETERTMLDRLCVRYGRTYKNGSYVGREHARAEHVPIGVSFDRSRIADFLAVRMFSSHGFEHLPYREQESLAQQGVISWDARTPTLIGHELKVSRSDWLTEFRDPEKAEARKRYCHGWYLVASDAAIVRDGELPEGWGLMVKHGRSLRVLLRAPRLVPQPLGMSQVAALARAVMQTEAREAAR